MSNRIGLLTAIPLALMAAAPAAHATLVIEPVFNLAAGTGPSDTTLGFYIPGLINPATGEPFLTADEPGEVVTYPAGFPADPILADVVRFYNNTNYDITSFTLSIVGTAVEPNPFDFTITRDPNVDARFGDVDGDGGIGLSDIFDNIEVSMDGRSITFSGGLIAIGARFTDFNLAMTTDGEPFLAALDASFGGQLRVPEPAAGGLVLLGILSAVGLSRPHRKTASLLPA